MTLTQSAEASPLAASATVYVVEDDELLRDVFGQILQSDGLRVETFGDANAFLTLPTLSRPSCLVLDLRMPRISGIEVLEILRKRGSRIPTIVVTGYGDVDSAVRAMKAGASDFIEKPVQSERLIALVRACLDKDQNDSRTDLGREAVREHFASLTTREQEIMKRVVTGMSNKLIARELGVSPRTVEHHRAHVMEKTGSRSLAELIRMAALLAPSEG